MFPKVCADHSVASSQNVALLRKFGAFEKGDAQGRAATPPASRGLEAPHPGGDLAVLESGRYSCLSSETSPPGRGDRSKPVGVGALPYLVSTPT